MSGDGLNNIDGYVRGLQQRQQENNRQAAEGALLSVLLTSLFAWLFSPRR
jgi:hypothetical protein